MKPLTAIILIVVAASCAFFVGQLAGQWKSKYELAQCRQNLSKAVSRGVSLEAHAIMECQRQNKNYPCF